MATLQRLRCLWRVLHMTGILVMPGAAQFRHDHNHAGAGLNLNGKAEPESYTTGTGAAQTETTKLPWEAAQAVSFSVDPVPDGRGVPFSGPHTNTAPHL